MLLKEKAAQVVKALACSTDACKTTKCDPSCPYLHKEPIPTAWAEQLGVAYGKPGTQMWESCDVDRICLDAIEVIKEGVINA